LPDGIVAYPKNLNFGLFWRPWYEKRWSLLWPFGTFCDHLMHVHFPNLVRQPSVFGSSWVNQRCLWDGLNPFSRCSESVLRNIKRFFREGQTSKKMELKERQRVGRHFEKSFFVRTHLYVRICTHSMNTISGVLSHLYVLHNRTIFLKLPPSTMAGFDLTTHSSSLLGGRRKRYH
jgi:hypothetical protein